jgi:hypothetical protein
MVIITDGIPNCSGQKGCTDSGLQTQAENLAITAGQKGLDIYTIYYGTNNSDFTWLKKLVTLNQQNGGNGQAFNAPKASDLANLMQQVCMNSHRLVW